MNYPSTPARFVGLDIGGSKDARHRVDGRRRHLRFQRWQHQCPKRQRRDRPRRTWRNFSPGWTPHGATEVFAGAGGVDTDDDAAALRALIAPFVPGAQVTVVHDTRLLLAAAGATEGVAVIAGTGSAAWGANAAGDRGPRRRLGIPAGG